MFGGPLSSLYYMGFVPCCQKEEDKSAREALTQINKVGARICWHRQTNRLQETVKATFSFFSGKKSEANGKDGSNNPIVKACFKLLDNDDGIPEIIVAKRSLLGSGAGGMGDDSESDFEFGLDEPPESSSSSKQKKKKKAEKEEKISINLKRIHTVVPSASDDTLVVLNTLEPTGQQTKEWVRFALDAQDQGTRNIFVHNLQVLMEWDRQRRNNCGELEYDETSAASTLKARAQKAAHFARRELEMKQTKRTREERKAKLVQESGGLKYTALAMARNATVT